MKTKNSSIKVIYTAKVKVVGGRGHGIAKSSDGHLEILLATPGTNRNGTNPEQLLAAGWAACFEDAIGIAAYKKFKTLPEHSIIDAEIDLCSDKDEFFLRARFNISIPGLNRELAQLLINEARLICPYTKALSHGIVIEFILV